MKLVSAIGKRGSVCIVGAGPGDPELLTIKAFRVLQEADCVLVDNLVSEDIISMIPSRIDIYQVGKKAGNHSVRQEDINHLLVDLALKGNYVVRLKGGDPLVFSRIGEEIAALREAEIDYEIVSGITAGLAAPAELGIALTHRDYSSGITFITGHRCGKDDYDWQALVNSNVTLVVYMPLKRLPQLVACLIDAGLEADSMAAAVHSASGREQVCILSEISELAEQVKEQGLSSPLLVIIGSVISAFESESIVKRRVQLEVIS